MLLDRLVTETRQRTPDKIALWFGEQHWTYTALDDTTDRIAAALTAAGVRCGDRVALFLPNCPELVFSYLACFKLGAISVPLNYRYRQPEAQYALEHSGSGTLIVHPALVGEVEKLPLAAMGIARRYLTGPAPRPDFAAFDELRAGPLNAVPQATFTDDQPAAILYTSGTTARPKGVTYTHCTLGHNCEIQTASFAFTPEDVHLISTAACHAAAFTAQLLPGLYSGGTCVLTHLPTPEQVVHAIQTRRVSRIQTLPASLEDLVEHLERHPAANLTSWRCCLAGGDVVPLDLHTRFCKMTGFDITELYGMTEALTCISNPPFGAKTLGSIGVPVQQTLCRVVDKADRDVPTGEMGELLVQSPAIMVGYWNNPAATAEALHGGWVHTGDLVRCDATGYFWFVSRKKEIIIRGGSNISPLEVEEVLDQHPAVHLSCVVGVPDKHYGEIVAAYVSLRADVTPQPTAEELRHFAAERIAAYMVPERITIMPELPLNSTGKVDRRRLHALVAAGAKDGAPVS
jgi:acyl-CoA synthetase (AMP-forming)/AMP-acid ligase II